jgi:Flp pilus assembly pilin Flp
MERLKNRVLRSYVRIREGSEGQGFVEYLMIVGLVGIALTAALIAFRGQISNALSSVGTGV